MDIIKRAAQELKDRVNKTSQIEKLLQESTSKENWQAHPKTLNTIADYTNSSEEWQIISKYLWEKLYKSDKSWIVTFKTLVLIEYLLKNGSPRCIMEFKDEIYKIRKLQDFQYVEDGEDKGASVRQRSKNIVDLLTDEDKLDHERQTAKELREKMSSVNNNPYGGMGSNSNGGNYGSASSSSTGSSKYAGFSKDSYKDQKYVGKSSKDTPTFNYKSGDSYDSTEFKGLDKYRKKEEKEEVQPKKNEKTQPAALSKPVEAPKVSIGQIKIQPPSGKPETTQPVVVAGPAKPAAQIVDLFDDEPTKQQPQSQEGEWNWSSTPQQVQQPPAVQVQKQQTQQPSFQQFQQAPQIYQQAPQTYQQAPQIYQQAPQVYQQPTQAPQYQLQQPQYYQPPIQQQQQPIKPVQTNPVDLFSNSAPVQQAPTKVQSSTTNQQEVDLFSDFQSSTQNQKKDNYSKDEFDLINLGDLKKEADKKQKDKEAKTQNANEFGFSTLTTQLDQFSINPTNTNFSAPNNFASPPQSNYSALNNLNWGQPQYVMPGYQNGMGVPGQQGYPAQGGYVQQGYGQPFGYNGAQNNNFRM